MRIALRKSILIVVQIALLLPLIAGPSRLSLAAAPQSTLQYLPGDDAVGGAAGVQMAPAIARGGDMQLVAWSDGRSQPAGYGYQYETSTDIYAMRLDANGAPLDAVAFPVAQAPGAQENPQIAWSGTHWLVLFESTGIGGTGYYEKHLAFVRVAPDGSLLDPAPVIIYNTVPITGIWSVASNGTDWVVAFAGSPASNDIQAITISAAGEVLQPATSLVEETYYLRFNMRLAYADGVYLLTWLDFSDTFALRFDENLAPLDPAPFSLLPGNSINDLSQNGDQFYILWVQQMWDYTIAMLGSRVGTDGTRLDGAGDNLSMLNEPDPYTPLSVTWDGSYWAAVWSASNLLRVARITSDGQVTDPGGVAVPGPASGASAGTALGGIQIAWAEYANSENEILSAYVSPANSAGDTIHTSNGGPMQVRSDVAAGANGYMFTYRSEIAAQSRIMAHPLDADGAPLTPEPIQLDAGSAINGPMGPSVAWNGSLYLVAWANASGIVAQRIQQDGSLVDPSPVLVMSGFGATDVAAVGEVFLVGGRTIGYSPEVIYPIGKRLRGSDGVILDASPIVLGASYTRSLALTAFGNRWLAVSHANYTHDDSMGGTQGRFIEENGSTGPIFGIHGPYSMGGNGIIEVAAASDGVTALVLQSAETTSGVETDLIARLVNSDGTIQDAINLTPWIGNQYRPRAAWDGSQYIVVYQEQKNRFAPGTLDPIDARGDLFAMRLTPDGSPIDPQGFAFSLSLIGETDPNIAASNGVALLSGSILRNPAPYAAYRIGYTLLGQNGNQPPVAVAGSSASGGDIPLEITFSSAGSSDPDGSLSSYLWDFGDGSTSTTPNPAHTFTTAGNYVVSLTVTDDQGAETTDTVAIEATNPNQAPVAVASADPLAGAPPLDVVFSARGSYDPDGSLGNFQWTFSDGGEYWGPTAYYTFYQPGIFTVTLTIYDQRGGTGSTSLLVYVGQPNQIPVAAAGADPSSGTAPLQVSFSSAGSHDPDGSLTAYAWDFGDGSSSPLANPTHTYTTPGSYTATLTVTDNQGATDSASVAIEVGGAVYGAALSGDLARSLDPGETASYTLTVTNTGNLADTFEIGVQVSGSLWTTSAPAAVGPLDAGASGTFAVQVTAPLTAVDGEQSQATVSVTSQGNGAAADSAVLTSTARVSYGVALTPGTSTGSGKAGETVAYTLTVTNTSNVSHTFTITTSGAWATHLPVTQVSLEKGQSSQIQVHVIIPIDAPGGAQEITTVEIQALGQPAVKSWAELTTIVEATALSRQVFFPLAVKGSG